MKPPSVDGYYTICLFINLYHNKNFSLISNIKLFDFHDYSTYIINIVTFSMGNLIINK